MNVVHPIPVKDTLMACFCRILFGRDKDCRERRLWVRCQVLELACHDPQFVIQHQRENCIYDKHRICKLFSQRFRINVVFPDEGAIFDSGSPYTLYLRHENKQRFVQLLPQERQHTRNMEQLYDLRQVSQDEKMCPVVATFVPTGNGILHRCVLGGYDPDRIYVVHPKAGTQYRIQVPEKNFLYVFVDEECVSCCGSGDSVNPHFFIVASNPNRVNLSIIVTESISRARQYLSTELHGIF